MVSGSPSEGQLALCGSATGALVNCALRCANPVKRYEREKLPVFPRTIFESRLASTLCVIGDRQKERDGSERQGPQKSEQRARAPNARIGAPFCGGEEDLARGLLDLAREL